MALFGRSKTIDNIGNGLGERMIAESNDPGRKGKTR